MRSNRSPIAMGWLLITLGVAGLEAIASGMGNRGVAGFFFWLALLCAFNAGKSLKPRACDEAPR